MTANQSAFSDFTVVPLQSDQSLHVVTKYGQGPRQPYNRFDSRQQSHRFFIQVIQTGFSNREFKQVFQTGYSNMFFKQVIQTGYSNRLFKQVFQTCFTQRYIKANPTRKTHHFQMDKSQIDTLVSDLRRDFNESLELLDELTERYERHKHCICKKREQSTCECGASLGLLQINLELAVVSPTYHRLKGYLTLLRKKT